MHDLPPELRTALAAAVARHSSPDVTATTARLVERYQQGSPADEPLLLSDLDAVAYATYRMPATYAAVRAALGEAARLAPGLAHPPRAPTDHRHQGSLVPELGYPIPRADQVASSFRCRKAQRLRGARLAGQ